MHPQTLDYDSEEGNVNVLWLYLKAFAFSFGKLNARWK